MTVTIGIDGYNLAIANSTGIATYARTLAATVARLGWSRLGLFGVDCGVDRALQEILFFERLARPQKINKLSLRQLMTRLSGIPPLFEIPLGATDTRPIAEQIPRFERIVTGNVLFKAAFTQFRKTHRLASLRIANPPDIMHWTCPIPLRIEGAANIYTVHDLVPLRMPYMTLDDKRLHHALVGACVDAADHLCAVSECSARELVELFPGAADKITTTYQTCDIADAATSMPEHESREVVTRLGLQPDGYFLFYGALEPKKNVARLIEAHIRLGSQTPLVIVTGRSWNSEAENSLLDRLLGQGNNIIVLQYLMRNVLQALITHARAVTFPSLHEGFGLPVLEAMQMGVPVLAGNSGGVVEVCGNDGVLVDAYDVGAIRDGLERLDNDADFRRELSRHGKLRAAQFSPARYSETMLATYDKLLIKDRVRDIRQ